ncbi:B-4DMT family transporter [Mycobacterium sp. 94-17]|uniref:B-4DMT family transporter n=1 Tax=Mycobacterium sp. 94-17 TaxID=2986147 RepID=UPI002D1EF61A|nr:B-4DMT family transporter [Mycobacterium sp. 94-17]MEB4210493.1 B-4DMT family transporter [Mycobacterium sp. 94-17]
MRNWMLRGLVYAAAMVVVRLFQGALINAWQTQAGLFSVALLLVFIIGVVVWGIRDGRADAIANPDPDRRGDLAMTWLLAGLVAGVVSGAVAWLLALVYTGLYTGGLINELTTFAAFTALCVFLPGIIGVTIGRWRVDRNPPPRRPGTDDERADTDVFSAVRGDDAPTGEIPTQSGARAEERTGSVATAERDARTDKVATTDSPTETIAKTEDDPKTEVIRTRGDDEHTKPDKA